MSHLNSGSKSELTEKVDDQYHSDNKAWLDWFGFVNSKLILQPCVCSATIMIVEQSIIFSWLFFFATTNVLYKHSDSNQRKSNIKESKFKSTTKANTNHHHGDLKFI